MVFDQVYGSIEMSRLSLPRNLAALAEAAATGSSAVAVENVNR